MATKGKNCYKKANSKHLRDAKGHFVSKVNNENSEKNEKKDIVSKNEIVTTTDILSFIKDALKDAQALCDDYKNKPVYTRKQMDNVRAEYMAKIASTATETRDSVHRLLRNKIAKSFWKGFLVSIPVGMVLSYAVLRILLFYYK